MEVTVPKVLRGHVLKVLDAIGEGAGRDQIESGSTGTQVPVGEAWACVTFGNSFAGGFLTS